MWTSFFLCALLLIAVLYGPGYALLRGLGLRRVLCLGCAPIASCIGYGLVAIAWEKLGVSCSWGTVLGPIVLVVAAITVTGRLRRAAQRSTRTWRPRTRDLLALGAYLAVGLAVCGYVFVKSLDTPASFYCRFDNQVHDTFPRVFADTSIWSPLATTFGAASLNSPASYYPATWHLLAALASSITGFDFPLIFNALNAVLSGVVYPISSFALMTILFPRRHAVVLAGSLTTMAFACFPWVLLLKGQLLANLISFSLVPAALALISSCLVSATPLRWRGLLLSAAALVFFFGIAHPNGLFTALIFVAPLTIRRCVDALRGCRCLSPANPLRRPWVVWGVGCVLCFVLWQVMLYAPPLQQVVLYNNIGNLNLTWPESFYAAAALSLYPDQPPQWLLAVVCLVGIAALIWQKRGWLVLPGAYMLLVYAACRCTEASYTLRTFLAGFWYSDPYRVLCCAELFLVPVAAVGLVAIAEGGARLTGALKAAGNQQLAKHRRWRNAQAPRQLACILTAAVFSLVNFFPFYVPPEKVEPPKGVEEPHFVSTEGTAIGFMHYLVTEGYDLGQEQVYSAEEEGFVRRVMDIVPAGALVINQPHDGSVFAYGLNGLNTYYRHIDTGEETEQSPIIREHLSELATNEEVADAVAATGARYVLQLDHDVPLDKGTWLIQTNEDNMKNYAGIDAIGETTPGFELVFSDGDMKLYRIV